MESNFGHSSSPLFKSTTARMVRRRTMTFFGVLLSITALVFLITEYTESAYTQSPSSLYRKFKDRNWVVEDEIRSLVHFATAYPDKSLGSMDLKAGLSPPAFGAITGASTKEWKNVIRQTAEASPVVIFSKTYCPVGTGPLKSTWADSYSRRAKALIESYHIEPQPLVIEVDLREDAELVKAQLYRLTGRGTFPNVLLRSKSIGGSDELHGMHASGRLERLLKDAGVEVHAV